MFIAQAHASEIISASYMAKFWYRDSPTSWHRATKFQISNALLHKVITQRSRKHKNQLPEPCLNHWILVTNT